jgi:hypothetical protein
MFDCTLFFAFHIEASNTRWYTLNWIENIIARTNNIVPHPPPPPPHPLLPLYARFGISTTLRFPRGVGVQGIVGDWKEDFCRSELDEVVGNGPQIGGAMSTKLILVCVLVLGSRFQKDMLKRGKLFKCPLFWSYEIMYRQTSTRVTALSGRKAAVAAAAVQAGRLLCLLTRLTGRMCNVWQDFPGIGIFTRVSFVPA